MFFLFVYLFWKHFFGFIFSYSFLFLLFVCIFAGVVFNYHLMSINLKTNIRHGGRLGVGLCKSILDRVTSRWSNSISQYLAIIIIKFGIIFLISLPESSGQFFNRRAFATDHPIGRAAHKVVPAQNSDSCSSIYGIRFCACRRVLRSLLAKIKIEKTAVRAPINIIQFGSRKLQPMRQIYGGLSGLVLRNRQFRPRLLSHITHNPFPSRFSTSSVLNMKRLIVCCDGIMNSIFLLMARNLAGC